jgi:hypothetical protein
MPLDIFRVEPEISLGEPLPAEKGGLESRPGETNGS